jgi:hypothetical protein
MLIMAAFGGRLLRKVFLYLYFVTYIYIYVYSCVCFVREIHPCPYEISGYHSNELSSVNIFLEHKLYTRSRTSKNYFVSVYRVYSVSIVNILMWICEVLYTKRRRFTVDYLCVLFVGDGVRRWRETREKIGEVNSTEYNKWWDFLLNSQQVSVCV